MKACEFAYPASGPGCVPDVGKSTLLQAALNDWQMQSGRCLLSPALKDNTKAPLWLTSLDAASHQLTPAKISASTVN